MVQTGPLVAAQVRDNHDARCKLKFGTCFLQCGDEREREEFGSRVRIWEVVDCLFEASEIEENRPTDDELTDDESPDA